MGKTGELYSSTAESSRIFDLLFTLVDGVSLPPETQAKKVDISFTASRDQPYFPVPFKETEVAAALKAVEGSAAALLADQANGTEKSRKITVNLEKTTAFLFQAYLAKIGGLGKLDADVKSLLKDTDILQAQSNPYRRMSANLYATAEEGEYYHIHGSLEASTTLRMLGLEAFRPDLKTHDDIVRVIEAAVKKRTVDELEILNAQHRQAGVKAFKHDEFLQTPHGQVNWRLPPWTVEQLEDSTPKHGLPGRGESRRLLAGVKVLEMCRIIAGPVIARILGEYGADVLKITSPSLSDVPFFQVDGNMGKRTADLDLKTPEGRSAFERLLEDVDVIIDGYRPGALDRLGYGVKALSETAAKRGKGIVYVNENCFGYQGEWAGRPGWQQIADCVSGIAWDQGRFMGLDEPVVPPFPISDYGTGCMGAIAALTGLYHRAARGGSWHGKTSLLHYDLLLYRAGLLPAQVQDQLRAQAGQEFLALRHAHSVDQISGTALQELRRRYPEFVDQPRYLDHWYSDGYKADVSAVLPVVEIQGLDISFARASRPNGADEASWDFEKEKDQRIPYVRA
ncbi:coA-transferase family III domain-containing protein [Hirsutella rhossiliensis]|uniref:CoA-transferase family III domain-containing protein n=1 Tax=Hirsutella rhossiliensis TaxID=111463 RepID=A0A9P8SD79_9HYPO|nr:coA-transferase family III domain-containing protein [Hirsutella rhossiliensis]KAH0958321.1 coA-transferase family III domain-containing protein [Hirsutella rhossiliensis]